MPIDYVQAVKDGRMVNISSAHSSNYKLRDRNVARAEEKGLEPCVCCGRGTTEKGRQWILCVGGGLINIANPDEEKFWWANDGGFMGCFAIGPTCARKLKKLGVPSSWVFQPDWE